MYSGASRSGAFGPRLLLTTPEQDQELARLDAEAKSLQAEIDKAAPDAKTQFAAWEKERLDEKAGDEKLPKEILAILRETPNKRSQPNTAAAISAGTAGAAACGGVAAGVVSDAGGEQAAAASASAVSVN